MIQYICDANPAHIIKKNQYDNFVFEGKHYCNKCFSKVKNIIKSLEPIHVDNINAENTRYKDEVAAQIAAQCLASAIKEEGGKDG